MFRLSSLKQVGYLIINYLVFSENRRLPFCGLSNGSSCSCVTSKATKDSLEILKIEF